MGPKKAKAIDEAEAKAAAPKRATATKKPAGEKTEKPPSAAALKKAASTAGKAKAAEKAPAAATKKPAAEKKPKAAPKIGAKAGKQGASDASDEYESSVEKTRNQPPTALDAAVKKPAAARAAPKRAAAKTKPPPPVLAAATRQTRKKASSVEEGEQSEHEPKDQDDSPKKAKMAVPKFAPMRAAAAKVMTELTTNSDSSERSGNEESEFDPEDEHDVKEGDSNCFVCHQEISKSALMEHIESEHGKNCPKLDRTAGKYAATWLYKWTPPACDCQPCAVARKRFLGGDHAVSCEGDATHDQTPPGVPVEFDGRLFGLSFEQPEDETDHRFYSWVTVAGDEDAAAKYAVQIRFVGQKLFMQSEWRVFPMDCDVDGMLYGEGGSQVMQGDAGWFDDAKVSSYRELGFEYIIRKV